MTISQLAARWGVSRQTVKKWIKPFSKEIGHYGRIFTPRQVNIILSHLE